MTASDAKKYSSDLFDLAELDKTVNDGYNNTVTITAGGTTYTVYIRRLLKPKITLNYGNSPYGEIMKASNIADSDKQKAKDAFDANNKYDANYLPNGKSTKVYYSSNAWGGSTDPKINLDRDETALFAFEYKGFEDPGFDAIDSLGNVVKKSDVTRTISVCVLPALDMKVTIIPSMFNTYSVDGDETHDVFTNANLTGSSKAIQPDIYKLEYSYTDNNLN